MTPIQAAALDALVAWRKFDRDSVPFLMDAYRPNDEFYAASRELRLAADRLIAERAKESKS